MRFPAFARDRAPGRGAGIANSSDLAVRDPRRSRRPQRAFLMGFSLVVLLYSLAVLLSVAWSGDIGVRCIFGNEVTEPIPAGYEWSGVDRPQPFDEILAIGEMPVANYSGYIRATRGLSHLVDRWVAVEWRNHDDRALHKAEARVRYRPSTSYVWSVVWFLQEMVIFLIGARVFWKRPYDASARLFFWLCVLTVGAYMGGYHWTEIVTEPTLIYPFAAFALFVPVVSLHFYLVFPRTNPILASHPRLVLGLLYGVPSTYLGVLWATMFWSWRLSSRGEMARVTPVLWQIRNLALGYIGVAVLLFGLCAFCVFWSYRWAATTAERNQVRWIWLATLISSLLIAVLLRQAWYDPSTFGRDSAAWPMFGVSLLYTVAYALSITRYRLMNAETFINRGMVYVAISVASGFLYSGVLVLSGVFFRDRFLTHHTTSRQAMVAGVTVVLVLTLSELARGRFQKAIDRRFFREKYKFDQAMRKMRLAVDRLVDRETLGRRVLEAAAEVLRLEWGAIYLNDAPGGPFCLAACQGPEPETRVLSTDHPLVERLRRAPGLRLPPSVSLGGAADDPAADAMIALGGEAAVALEADNDLAGMLVLGPKRSGMPYEEEELAFLAALSSVATLALHSSGIQQTLDTLNCELRDKVGKIAEQQRRILILQDQLSDRGVDHGDGASGVPPRAGGIVGV